MDSTLSPLPGEDLKGRQYPRWLPKFLYAVLATTVVGIVSFAIFKPILVLPRVALGPGFLLSNAQGETVSNETYRGRITLYSFSYLACEREGCAQPLSAIAGAYHVMEKLNDIDTPLALATISLDPAGDTSAELDQVAASWPEGKVRWDYLTAEPMRIKHIVGGGFELYYTEKEADSGRKIDFQPRYILVDERGLIRAYYRQNKIDAAILERDIRLLDEENRLSQGVGRLGYEAAHLFVCYP